MSKTRPPTSPNVPFFEWTEAKEQAALDLAEGKLGVIEIAERAGVTKRQLLRWRADPTFAARVTSNLASLKTANLTQAIGQRERRLVAYQDRWERMQQVIEERAASPDLAQVPGGTTGLLVHDVKGIGKGDDFQLIDLYEVDTGLLKEMRELEKQAAVEVGDWTEKQEHTGKDGGPLLPPITFIEVCVNASVRADPGAT